jgi:methionine synthase II (cobalamin-independent)
MPTEVGQEIAKMLEKRAKDLEMREAVIAQGLMFRLAAAQPGERNKAVIGRAYDALKRHFPDEARWTWRRVRSLVEQDVSDDAVRLREVRQILEAIEREKADRAALEAARREHAEYVAETLRMATALAVADEAFHRPEIERLRSFAGRMDSAGVENKD